MVEEIPEDMVPVGVEVAKERCTTLFAATVVTNVRFLLSHQMEDLFSVTTASTKKMVGHRLQEEDPKMKEETSQDLKTTSSLEKLIVN